MKIVEEMNKYKSQFSDKLKRGKHLLIQIQGGGEEREQVKSYKVMDEKRDITTSRKKNKF